MTSKTSLILLLRGINLGPNRRVSMPDLRALLTEAGFEDVQTYVQSGNVVLVSRDSASDVAGEVQALIAERFGFDVDVIARTADELADVVARNPLADVAVNPKRYQVSFLDAEPDPELVTRIAELATDSERVVAIGRELYAWHPDGVARSKLSAKLAAAGGLGVRSTARNWATVTKLLEMSS